MELTLIDYLYLWIVIIRMTGSRMYSVNPWVANGGDITRVA